MEQHNNQTPSYDVFLRTTPLVVGGLVVLCCIVLVATIILSKIPEKEVSAESHTATSTAFNMLRLEARAAYVYDPKTELSIFERNAYEPLPLASITKLLSIVVAQAEFPAGTIITVSPEALATDGDSGLVVGERWPLKNLLQYILTTSSNDGVAAIAYEYDNRGNRTFVEKLNVYSKALGLSSFSFANPTGLDTSGTLAPTNFGSARDVAFLFAHALTVVPEILDTTSTRQGSISSLDRTHSVVNTNTIIDTVPNAIGSKTGFTDAAGGNLVLSFDVGIGHPVILVVLGSSKEGRFTDMQTLVDATLSYYDTPQQ